MSAADLINTIAWQLKLPSDELACLNKANAAPQVASMMTIIDNLSRNWHPTGYYAPADVRKVLAVIETKAAEAGDALAAAPSSTSDAERVKAMAFNDAVRLVKTQGHNYAQAAAQAEASGVAIDAPGFKQWVVASMLAISNVWVTAVVLDCNQSTFASLFDRAAKGMAKIGEAAWGVLGVTYDLAKGAVKALEAGLGLVAWLTKYSKWIVAGTVVGIGSIAAWHAWQRHQSGKPVFQLPDSVDDVIHSEHE